MIWHIRLAAALLALGLGLMPVLPVAALTCAADALTPLEASRRAYGESLTVAGTVTGAFLGPRRLRGVYLQTQPQQPGLFVFLPEPPPPWRAMLVAGQRVQLQGVLQPWRSRPQLAQVTALIDCGRQPLTPTPLDAAALATLDPAMGNRLVQLTGPLRVLDTGRLPSHGQLRLGFGDRPFAPPRGPMLWLDDGSYETPPRPPYLQDGTRRIGDYLDAVTGVLVSTPRGWQLHPTLPLRLRVANPRPPRPPPAAGPRLAFLNLQDYRVPAPGGERAAGSHPAQQGRLAATLRALDADVLALAELQNHPAATADLLAALNATLAPAARYRAATSVAPGTAATQVALWFRPARVTLRAAPRWDLDPAHHRPVLAVPLSVGGQPLWVLVAHFRSKGGCPAAGEVDRGEGCWSPTRRRQAEALVRWLHRLSPVAPALVMGDLNAYAGETPLAVLTAAGLVDLVARGMPAAERYSYVYEGRSGYLDHAWLAGTLPVQAVRFWHINADEPPMLAHEGAAPGDGVWRSSDHDPLLIDLASVRELATAAPAQSSRTTPWPDAAGQQADSSRTDTGDGR